MKKLFIASILTVSSFICLSAGSANAQDRRWYFEQGGGIIGGVGGTYLGTQAGGPYGGVAGGIVGQNYGSYSGGQIYDGLQHEYQNSPHCCIDRQTTPYMVYGGRRFYNGN